MTYRLSLASAFLALSGVAGLWAGQVLLPDKSKSIIQVPREPSSYSAIVKQVLPAVVTIQATPKATVARARMPGLQGNPFRDLPGLPDELRKRFEEFERQPDGSPDSFPHRAFGSGFVADPNGVILTNAHVVRGADRVEVQLQDGRKFVSRNIHTDPKTDLAIVRLDVHESLPYLELGDSDAMEIGDRVLAVGAPLGMAGTVTSGIISAKARDIHLNMYEDFLQTDAAINPGNSGGPLLNLEGKVIGINTAIKSGTGGFQGIGLAVSSNLARTVMTQLLKDGSVHRGYLGVQAAALSPEVAERMGLSNHEGVVLGKVSAGTPAAKAGLQDGDIVTAVAGKPVKDVHALQRMVAELPLGKPVELTVCRDGARKTLPVTIEEQPRAYGLNASATSESADEDAQHSSLDRIGVKVTELTPERAKQLGYPEKTTGVVITEVEPNSLAADAGLRSGTLILKVDRQPVHTVEDARKALEKVSDKGVLLQVRTAEAGTAYVLLKPVPTR
jgi:serine protease Do